MKTNVKILIFGLIFYLDIKMEKTKLKSGLSNGDEEDNDKKIIKSIKL